MQIEIKDFTNRPGNETDAFSYTLYLDGTKAANVSNDGWGGCNIYHWFEPTLRAPFIEQCTAQATPILKSWGFDDAVVTVYVRSGEILDVALTPIVEAIEEEKKLRKLCKTKVVFRLRDDEEGSWRGFSADWKSQEQEIRARLKKDFGDLLGEIANERFA